MHWIGVGILIFIGFAMAPYVLGIGFGLVRLLLVILPGIIGGIIGYWLTPDIGNPLLEIGGVALPYVLYLCREPILSVIMPILTVIERMVDRASWLGFIGGIFLAGLIMAKADLMWSVPSDHGGTILAIVSACIIGCCSAPYLIAVAVAKMRGGK